MSVRYKVHAPLANWVRRYATVPNAWAHMMTFWLFYRFGADPQTVLAQRFVHCSTSCFFWIECPSGLSLWSL